MIMIVYVWDFFRRIIHICYTERRGRRNYVLAIIIYNYVTSNYTNKWWMMDEEFLGETGTRKVYAAGRAVKNPIVNH
jgi:hypothetical protein